MTRPLIVLLLVLPCVVLAQPRIPATTQADLLHLRKVAAAEPDARKLTDATHGRYPTAYINGRCMVGFLAATAVDFDAALAANPHVTIGARIGDVVSVRVDAHHLDQVHAIPGITYIELAGKARPDLDKVLWTTRVDSVHRGINLPMAYTGRDVLIGICDWGFDYTHPDLYDTLLTQTRVRAAWDQYKQSGPAPAGFPYGTAYTTPAELLAAGSDTSNIYGHHYHGTHVAGIAGGSGAGTPYRGVAFEAQFLLATWLIDAAAVIDCYAWMKQIADADGKRLVINQSWGLHHMGTLDGNSLISQAINALAAEGVVFVNSAGNNGDVNFHIRKDFAGDTLRTRIQFYSYSANPNMWGQSISMWGEAGNLFSASVLVTNNTNQVLTQSPWYSTADQPAYLDSMIVVGSDTILFNLTADAAHPLNGRPHFRLRVSNRIPYLRVGLQVTAPNGTVHLWNVTELTTEVGNWGQAFLAPTAGWTAGDKLYGISEPATTQDLISVAAFSSEYLLINGNLAGGAIASFSSYGPTLDERVKPDIAAPGVSVASAISSFADEPPAPLQNVPFNGENYPFARLSGTSMSSPAVAGIVALLLEADPTLSAQEVKDIIMTTARTDQHTGAIPAGGSTRWGMGKVNAYRAIVEALGVVGVPQHDEGLIGVWPNPTQDLVRLTLPQVAGEVRCTVRDLTGRVVLVQPMARTAHFVVDLAPMASGTYLFTIEADGLRRSVRVVKH